MADRPERKQEWSKVEVTFNDGQVAEYVISAGVGIARHLAEEGARTGLLTFWNKDDARGINEARSIPLRGVREYVLRPHTPPEEGETHGG